MKVLPDGKDVVISLTIITLVPNVPFVLAMMPLREALKMLAGVLC
jgi:hypothetical protein